MILAAANHVATPSFDWAELSPIVALGVGTIVCLMLGLLPGKTGKTLSIWAGVAAAGTAAVRAIILWGWGHDHAANLVAKGTPHVHVVANSIVIDRASLAAIIIASASAITGLAIAARARGTEDAGHGETASLILASTTGMAILGSANDLVTVFLGLELLSIPLYVLCASHVDRAASLESGLKYLILGSVGSATALMGLALIYGATGSMEIYGINAASGAPELRGLIYPGIALLIAGFGFKLSLAPLHQWTPDVYDGAPTAVTAFMSVGTKAAALIVTARLLGVMLPLQVDLWQPILYVLAAASIIVGNVGALGQPSMKRLMGYSSVAQAGYLIAALAAKNSVGPMLAYLVAYSVSTLAVFAVVAAREVERPDLGDDIAALDGLGRERPLLAWLGTIGMFGLAGLPLTAGFFGKVILAQALIRNGLTWLAVVLIVGSIISLAYYIPPVIRMWRPAPEPATGGADASADVPDTAPAHGEPYGANTDVNEPAPKGGLLRAPWELGAVAVVFAIIAVGVGVWPEPLFRLANDAQSSLFGLR